MRNARVYGIAALAVLAVAAVAVAQTTVNPLPDTAPAETTAIDAAPAVTAVAALAKTGWGDAQKGASLAGACAACHGLDGNAMQQGAPRIAGMPERYVAKQLALFKDNLRIEPLAPLMKPYADILSAQDMRDVGAHFAAQRSGAGVAVDTVITDPASPYKGMKFYEPGQNLYRVGDASRGIPACFACHGPSGSGNPGPAYPHVGGQEAGYVALRLQEYRSGKTSQPDRHQFDQMAAVAKSLTDEEIEVRKVLSFVDGRLEDFNTLVVGKSAGDKVSGKVKISADAQNEALRGQEVEVDIEIHEVRAVKLPELDEGFLDRIGGFENIQFRRLGILVSCQRAAACSFIIYPCGIRVNR